MIDLPDIDLDAPDWTPRERCLAQMLMLLRDRLNDPTPRPTRLYSLEITRMIRPTDQAFPCPDGGHRGMSIREWLAGQCLPGVIDRRGHLSADAIAEDAVKIADAMLRRLNDAGPHMSQ